MLNCNTKSLKDLEGNGNKIKMNEEGRIFFWDNLKVLLIILVVVGHSVDFYTPTSQMMKDIYLFIYTFHMPLFIFVSGYFSKTMIDGKQFRIAKVISYFLLYLLLKLCFFVLSRYIFGDINTQFRFFVEGGPPWYLFAMGVWLCISYVIHNIKPVIVISFSITIGVLVGYYKIVTVVDLFSLTRILVFFPFFISGYYFNGKDLIKILKCVWLKWFSLITITIVFVVIFVYGRDIYTLRGFFTGRNSYIALGEPVFGGIYRFLFYGLSTILSLAIMYITPNGRIFITKFGNRTLQVYFIHYLVLMIYQHYNLDIYLMNVFPYNWELVYLCLAVGLAFVLSLKIFEFPFKKIMGLKLNKILRK